MSDSIDENAARAAKAGLISQELSRNVEAPLAIKEGQITAITQAQSGLGAFLSLSTPKDEYKGVGPGRYSESILQEQKKDTVTPTTLKESADKLLSREGDLPQLKGYKTNEFERSAIQEIYSDPSIKTSEQRRSSFSSKFGEKRGGELFGAVEEFTNKEKKLEGVSIGDSKTLEKEVQSLREKKEEGVKQLEAIKEQSKAAQESTKAAQSMEVSAKSMESAAALISKGVEQNFKGLLDVAFSGADFLQNSNVVAELESTIKRLFIQYREEETGKKPALSPTSPRTAVA